MVALWWPYGSPTVALRWPYGGPMVAHTVMSVQACNNVFVHVRATLCTRK